MLLRLLVGLLLGLIAGGVVAAALVVGLHVSVFAGTGGMLLAYLTAALAGALTGLVAGKPIWSSGAKVEAGLKAFFGALIGAALMFALRRWAGGWIMPELPQIGVDQRVAIGDLPAASLPMLAAVLGAFFGLDNTDSGDQKATSDGDQARVRRRVAGGAKREESGRPDRSTKTNADEMGEEAELGSKRANR